MMNQHPSTRSLFVASWLLLTAFGCGTEPQPMPEVSVNAPDKFSANGVRWEKEPSVQQSDNECLSKFFSRNQGLVGSPEFEGQPVVFHSGKKDRRFYWHSAAVDGASWQCVEYRSGKFSVSNGTEDPFQ